MRLNCIQHPDSRSRPSEADINSAGALTKAAFQPVIVIVVQADENSLTGRAARASSLPLVGKAVKAAGCGRMEGRDPRAQFSCGFSKRWLECSGGNPQTRPQIFESEFETGRLATYSIFQD